MNRFFFAALLASAGFAAAGPLSAQTVPVPQGGPDRVMTRDDAMAQADTRFDRMDANKDGKIDAIEMASMRPRPPAGAMPPPPPADGAAPPPPRDGRMMARLDANGDGAVDRSEFRTLAAQRFDRVDANKDGKIDADERQAARDAMGMRGGRGQMNDMPAPPPPPGGAPKPDAGQ